MQALSDRGLLDEYPHSLVRVREDSFGAAVLSKRPLADSSIWMLGDVPMLLVTVVLDDASVQIVNWHPLPPRTPRYVAIWNDQYAALDQWVAEQSGPVLIIGDFNATQHARWMQQILQSGFQSAHVQTGRGYAVTYPNGTSRVPPIRIDHLLMSSHCVCRQIREGVGRGSDHKPLLADLILQ